MLKSRSLVSIRKATLLKSNRLSTSARKYKYFENVEIKNNVGIIRLNGPEKMNTISSGMQQEAEKIFTDEVLVNKDIKAVVFISSKTDNFIAGADINQIKETTDKSKLKAMILKGHATFEALKNSKIPLVSAINGAALGGGLEWAMYCDYRIATTNKKTVLGLPEVKLGLLPGMAGTYHLPRLIGYANALDMILTGKTIKPDKAKKMGLIDLVVDSYVLEDVAIRQAEGLINGSVKPSKRKFDILSFLLESNPIGRKLMFGNAKKMVDKNSGGHYPAPYKIIEVLEENMDKKKFEHLNDEANKFIELANTTVSESLIGIFQGTSAVKKHTYGKLNHNIENIAVLGAGLMGAGIAQVSVDNGKYRVLLKDKDASGVNRGEKVIDDALNNKLKKKKITSYEYNNTISRLVPLHDNIQSWTKHFSQADIVIEAVFEDLDVKHKVIKEMEMILPPYAIFASNTSAIPIAKIAEGSKRPERVIGMHYFSPVPLMPLLEIIPHAGTAPEVCAAAMEIGTRQGKTPIFVKDVPGFFVNRCLSPQMVEVISLIQDGVDLETLDRAMKSYGMPVGPITLSDEVGIDISYHVGSFMSKADLGVRMHGANHNLMKIMLDKGLLGRKSGKGFYLYPKDAKKGAKKSLNPEVITILKTLRETEGWSPASKLSIEDIQMRLISRFINEAAFCLQDDIIRNPVDGDIGAVFGVGFPPFRGGPFRLLDTMGVQTFVDTMYRFRDLKGDQFEPAQILKDYAQNNKKFHT